jgi:predicted metal-dependent hydrolase
MWVIHLSFVLETTIWTVISLAMDPAARRHPLRVLRSLRRLRRSPFTSPRLLRQLLQYNRRGFHPNDRDTTQLVAEWRSRLFGSEGDLRELLAG